MNAEVWNVFCGEKRGEILFNSAKTNPEFSSAYTLVHSRSVDTITVPVIPLDEITEKHAIPFLIKIDVEGAELDVLRGAQKTLKNTDAVIIETSVAPRFKNAPMFKDVVATMGKAGFAVFDMLAGSNKNGKLNQVDLVFVKENATFR